MNETLSEQEISPIFNQDGVPSAPIPPQPEEIYNQIQSKRKVSSFKLILIFLVLPLIIGAALNAPAFFKRVGYWWGTEYQNQETPPEDSPLAFLPPVETIPQTDSTDSADNDQGILYIPKIKVSAPIVWDVPDNEVLNKLKNGVVHYSSTAKPGEMGNVFLIGHSSGFFWQGNYTQVFTLLDKLVVGDRIYIKNRDKEYTYQVANIITVKPNQTEVLNSSDKPILSLMTCVPVGTNLKRLVVQADQISPEPGMVAESEDSKLPEEPVLFLPSLIIP